MRIKIALLLLVLASLACMEPVIVTPTPTAATQIVSPTPTPPSLSATPLPAVTATVTPPAAAGEPRGLP
jgi:hypothetical protein